MPLRGIQNLIYCRIGQTSFFYALLSNNDNIKTFLNSISILGNFIAFHVAPQNLSGFPDIKSLETLIFLTFAVFFCMVEM